MASRHRLLVPLMLLTAALLAACGGSDSDAAESPEGALLQFIDYTNKGQHGRRWDLVHPVHQALISRDRYIECESRRNRPGDIKVKVLEVYDEPVTLEGQRFDSKAITVELQANTILGDRQETDTVHAIPVGDEWRFPLNSIDQYRNGNCPS